MKKLIIELSDERLITPSGLSLVGQLLGKSRFIKKCNTMKVDSKRSQSQIKNGDILLSYIGLLCQGKTAYEDIREMSADLDYYELALGITRSIPSAETLRQRIDDIGSSLRKNILDADVEMFHTDNIESTPISEEFVPVDLDVTPMDNSKTHKEGVSYTYKGVFRLCSHDGIHRCRRFSCKYRTSRGKPALPMQHPGFSERDFKLQPSAYQKTAACPYGFRE